jgi:hypothetical protein
MRGAKSGAPIWVPERNKKGASGGEGLQNKKKVFTQSGNYETPRGS